MTQLCVNYLFLLQAVQTVALTNRRIDLQFTLSNLVKKTFFIQQLSQFDITSSQDEFLLSRGSTTSAGMEKSYPNVKSKEENQKLVMGIVDSFDFFNIFSKRPETNKAWQLLLLRIIFPKIDQLILLLVPFTQS